MVDDTRVIAIDGKDLLIAVAQHGAATQRLVKALLHYIDSHVQVAVPADIRELCDKQLETERTLLNMFNTIIGTVKFDDNWRGAVRH